MFYSEHKINLLIAAPFLLHPSTTTGYISCEEDTGNGAHYNCKLLEVIQQGYILPGQFLWVLVNAILSNIHPSFFIFQALHDTIKPVLML